MNHLSAAFPGDSNLLLPWALVVIVLAAWALFESLHEVVPTQQWLLSRLALTRLSRMLTLQNLYTASYIRHTPRRLIAAQIRTCEACSCKQRCDAALNAGERAEFHFCPSSPYFRSRDV